jgi:hypothetical protein
MLWLVFGGGCTSLILLRESILDRRGIGLLFKHEIYSSMLLERKKQLTRSAIPTCHKNLPAISNPVDRPFLDVLSMELLRTDHLR